MAKQSGMYSSSKRKKELQRQKKQEEKRLKRQKDNEVSSQVSDGSDSKNIEPESP